MVDLDGSFIYSSVVAVKTKCNSNDMMSIFPNPIQSVATLSFTTGYRGRATLIITNAIGQQISVETLQVNKSINVVPVDVHKQLAGLYFLSLINDKGERLGEIQRLIKE